MKVRINQAGFTLIEITLVLAITGALLVVVITSLSGSQAQVDFTDAVETTTSAINSAKNEAQSTLQISSAANGEGGTSGQFFWASVVEISTSNSTSYLTDSDYVYNGSNPTTLTQTDSSQVKIPWQVTVSNCPSTAPCYLVFHLQSTDNILQAYTATPSGADPLATILEDLESSPPAKTTMVLDLADNYGHSATISIDEADGGLVTRSYQ